MLAMKTKNATKPGNVTASRTLDAGQGAAKAMNVPGSRSL